MRPAVTMGHIGRAWGNTWVSLAVLDTVAVALLLLFVGGQAYGSAVRAVSGPAPDSSGSDETGHGARPQLPGIPMKDKSPRQVIYLVGSREEAGRMEPLLQIAAFPGSASYQAVIMATPTDESHLTNLLYAGEHPRPAIRVVDLRDQ